MKRRAYLKLSAVVLLKSLIPAAIALDMGPSNDKRSARDLLPKARDTVRPDVLYADAGYDIPPHFSGSRDVDRAGGAAWACAVATRTMARMPTLIADGRLGHALATVIRSGMGWVRDSKQDSKQFCESPEPLLSLGDCEGGCGLEDR